MGRLYKRKLELLIGKTGGKGVSIKDLRVRFTIDMDDSKETNTANLEIYNLKVYFSLILSYSLLFIIKFH